MDTVLMLLEPVYLGPEARSSGLHETTSGLVAQVAEGLARMGTR
jgi:hypothetical protein